MLSIHSVSDYDRGAITTLIGRLLDEAGDTERLRARGRRVLLKPNFVMPAPRHDTSTTHPDVYMGIADALIARGFAVGIGESPAFGTCAGALKAHGVFDECRERAIEVVEFRDARVSPGVAGDRHFERLTIARALDEWDSLINVPKVKTHRQFAFTGATKNLYGAVVGKRKFMRHNLCANDPVRFARMILANARAVDPVLHIGDGIEAMHVVGPRGGAPFALGALIIADDPLAHDLAMCHLIDLEPESTPLFLALGEARLTALRDEYRAVLADSPLSPAGGFVHAPLIHISFSPMAVARSALRTLRYRFAG